MVGLTDAVNNAVSAQWISTWTGPRFGIVERPFMSRLLFVGQSSPLVSLALNYALNTGFESPTGFDSQASLFELTFEGLALAA
jgi:hypothetical protein